MDFCLGETCGVGGETLGERICEPPDSSDAVDPLDLLDVLDPATRTGAAPGAPPRQPDEPDEPEERAGFLLGGSGRVGGPLRSMAGPGRGCTIGQGFFCAALITPGKMARSGRQVIKSHWFLAVKFIYYMLLTSSFVYRYSSKVTA